MSCYSCRLWLQSQTLLLQLQTLLQSQNLLLAKIFHFSVKSPSILFVVNFFFFAFILSGKSGCKRPVSIIYRNRSTEALAHSITELAKSVLFRSGGHLVSSVYVRDSETTNVKTPNHVLHMCALQLAMYGLGISNNASSSWESRSYSTHVATLTSKNRVSHVLRSTRHTKIDESPQDRLILFFTHRVPNRRRVLCLV